MKKYIEMILRKIGVSMLALLMVMTTYFSNSGGSLFLKTKKVQADTGETTLAMSQAMSSNKIPAIGRAASEGLLGNDGRRTQSVLLKFRKDDVFWRYLKVQNSQCSDL